jgi:hypothetical protein
MPWAFILKPSVGTLNALLMCPMRDVVGTATSNQSVIRRGTTITEAFCARGCFYEFACGRLGV